jgi:hypothetical protein
VDAAEDSGLTWHTVVRGTPGGHDYGGFYVDTVSSSCLVRIYDAADGVPADTSDAVFALVSSLGTRQSPLGAAACRGERASLAMVYDLRGRRLLKVQVPQPPSVVVLQQLRDGHWSIHAHLVER